MARSSAAATAVSWMGLLMSGRDTWVESQSGSVRRGQTGIPFGIFGLEASVWKLRLLPQACSPAPTEQYAGLRLYPGVSGFGRPAFGSEASVWRQRLRHAVESPLPQHAVHDPAPADVRRGRVATMVQHRVAVAPGV